MVNAFQAVKYRLENKTMQVGPFYFMAYHSVLKTSKDYISALQEARKLAGNITKTIHSRIEGAEDVEVFPYR